MRKFLDRVLMTLLLLFVTLSVVVTSGHAHAQTPPPITPPVTGTEAVTCLRNNVPKTCTTLQIGQTVIGNANVWTGAQTFSGAVSITQASSPFGTSITPYNWQPYTTTAGTTNGSPVITVSGGDAQYFRNGDHVSLANCSSCTVVVSGGGTTTITLDANASTTNAVASITVGLARYNPTSAITVNTVGLSNLLLGAAANGYGDWSGVYDGPGMYPSIGLLKVVSPVGGRSAQFASRLSDTPPSSGLKQMENVVHLAILDSKPSTIIGGGWNVYNQANLMPAAAPSVLGLGFHQEEDSLYNGWTSPYLDPYQINVQGYSVNKRLDCGIGSNPIYTATNCSAAVQIINNGAQYKSGIIIGNDALDTAGGTTTAPAFSMGPWHELAWYRGASQIAWGIFSTAATGNHYIWLSDSSGNGDMRVEESALSLNGAAGSANRVTNYKTAAVARWQTGATNTAESGGNAGSDWALSRFDDSGVYQGIALFSQRSTGNVGVGQGSASYPLDVAGTVRTAGSLLINGAAGSTTRVTNFQSSASNRFQIGLTNTAESGGNAGSNYAVSRFDDSGAFIDVTLLLVRSTGAAQFSKVVRPGKFTVATLPTCNAFNEGLAIATDLTAITYNGTPTGGGSLEAPVFCNTVAWTIH